MTEFSFSIVLPTHNRPAMLAEAIDSLRAQSLGNLEVIVVDDQSTPNVDSRSLGQVHGHPVRLLRNDTSIGGAASKTAGARQARGDFIGFLDDDDLLDPRYIQTLNAAFVSHPDVDLFFVDVEWFGDAPLASDRSHRSAAEAVIASTSHRKESDGCILFDSGLPAALIVSTPMQFQRPVLRRKVLDIVGGFRPECLLWDCDWAIRAAFQVRCGYIPQSLYRQREQGQGYFSRPGRALAMAESIYEIADRVRRDPPIHVNAATQCMLDNLTGKMAFDLAYVQSQQGEFSAAMRHWWISQRLSPQIGRLKFPVGALWRALASR